jgi:hypothetical protein
MYFGNESQSWKKHGVAFLDLNKSAVTVGRAYLVTEEQFGEIWCQEGRGSKWYGKVVTLGTYNGYPVKTFTNTTRRTEKAPSQAYLDVIAEGMKELLGETIIAVCQSAV